MFAKGGGKKPEIFIFTKRELLKYSLNVFLLGSLSTYILLRSKLK
jgi:hypothetical protein